MQLKRCGRLGVAVSNLQYFQQHPVGPSYATGARFRRERERKILMFFFFPFAFPFPFLLRVFTQVE